MGLAAAAHRALLSFECFPLISSTPPHPAPWILGCSNSVAVGLGLWVLRPAASALVMAITQIHTSEESPRIMARRLGRRTRRLAPSRILQRAELLTRSEATESSRRYATPSRSATPSSQAGGPQRLRMSAAPAPALAGLCNA